MKSRKIINNNYRKHSYASLLFALILSLTLSSSLLSGCGQKKEEKVNNKVRVETRTVERGTLEIRTDYIAALAPNVSVGVVPFVSANVEEVYVKVGDKVKSGDLLAQLDDTSADLSVRSAEDAVDTAKAGKDAAEIQSKSGKFQADSSVKTLENTLKGYKDALKTAKKQKKKLKNSRKNLAKARDASKTAYANAKRRYKIAENLYIQFQTFLETYPDCRTTPGLTLAASPVSYNPSDQTADAGYGAGKNMSVGMSHERKVIKLASISGAADIGSGTGDSGSETIPGQSGTDSGSGVSGSDGNGTDGAGTNSGTNNSGSDSGSQTSGSDIGAGDSGSGSNDQSGNGSGTGTDGQSGDNSQSGNDNQSGNGSGQGTDSQSGNDSRSGSDSGAGNGSQGGNSLRPADDPAKRAQAQALLTALTEAGLTVEYLSPTGLNSLKENADDGGTAYTGSVNGLTQLDTSLATLDGNISQLRSQISATRDSLDQARKMARLASAGTDVYDAQIQAAETGVEAAKYQKDMYRLTSPIDGIVEDVTLKKDNMAAQGMAAFTIVEKESMAATFYVTEEVSRFLQIGDPVNVVEDENSEEDPSVVTTGYITMIGMSADPQKGLFKVEAEMPAVGKSRLAGGTSVRISLVSNAVDQQILVPYDSVYYDNGQAYVYLIIDDKAVRTDVSTGLFNEKDIVITEGLGEGDSVVTTWASGLKDGAKVEVVRK